MKDRPLPPNLLNGYDPETRMDEFDKDEWYQVCRTVRPDWTEAQFDKAWADFCEAKRRKAFS